MDMFQLTSLHCWFLLFYALLCAARVKRGFKTPLHKPSDVKDYWSIHMYSQWLLTVQGARCGPLSAANQITFTLHKSFLRGLIV